MGKFLYAVLFSLIFVVGAAVAQTPQNRSEQGARGKAKAAGSKITGQTRQAGQEVGDKAEDVKDQAAKGVTVAGDAVGAVGEKAVEKTKAVGDNAVEGTKSVGSEVGDKAEDVKDQTAKGAKKTGNWFSRGLKKVGWIFGDEPPARTASRPD